MTNSPFSKRFEPEGTRESSAKRSRGGGEISRPPLDAEEIESLIRSTRDSAQLSTNETRDEELGPGDVQHLRGNSTKPVRTYDEPTLSTQWPGMSNSPETLLTQAEEQLARAMAGPDTEHGDTQSSLPEITIKSYESLRQSATTRSLTLEDLGDLELDISIELGRAELTIEDVMKLREGSVVSLDKLAGDPVDIVANGRLVARGELIVIQGKFGVRLSEVL